MPSICPDTASSNSVRRDPSYAMPTQPRYPAASTTPIIGVPVDRRFVKPGVKVMALERDAPVVLDEDAAIPAFGVLAERGKAIHAAAHEVVDPGGCCWLLLATHLR